MHRTIAAWKQVSPSAVADGSKSQIANPRNDDARSHLCGGRSGVRSGGRRHQCMTICHPMRARPIASRTHPT